MASWMSLNAKLRTEESSGGEQSAPKWRIRFGRLLREGSRGRDTGCARPEREGSGWRDESGAGRNKKRLDIEFDR